MRMLPLVTIALFLASAAACPPPHGPGEGEGEGSVGEGEGEGGEGEGEGGEGEGEGGSPGCHNAGECTAGASCASPDDPQQCGAQPVPIDSACASNADCGTDVCDYQQDACGQSHLACVAPCTGDLDCAAGETCNSGRCEKQACQDGFICPSWTVCGTVRPDPLNDDSKHGCIAVPCATDQDCPVPTGGFVVAIAQGFCVNAICSSGPGTCAFPVP